MVSFAELKRFEEGPLHSPNIRRILTCQRSLQAAIDSLSCNTALTFEEKARLHNATEEIEFLRIYLSSFIAASFYTEYCPPSATSLAQKVFDIPELFELILLKLEKADLLTAQCVNRQFRKVIGTSSVRLQRRLSLVPHPSPYLWLPFESRILGAVFKMSSWLIDGVEVKVYPAHTGQIDQGNNTHSAHSYTAVISGSFTLPIPDYGPTCRRMLICHPPITEMKAITKCCEPVPLLVTSAQSKAATHTVSNPAGLTLGDLSDSAKQLEEQHRHCPNADVVSHCTETGAVEVRTQFRGEVELKEDDPLLLHSRAEREKLLSENAKRKKGRKRMKDFVEAKRAGECIVP